MFDFVLFDLDGTLTDSYDGIINSVRHSLKKLGAPCPDDKRLKCFIGPPLWDSFVTHCGFDKQTAERAVEYYREYYSVNGWQENKVYDGVEEMLQGLKAKGKTLGVATSKPEHYSKKIVNLFGLDKYFDFVAGATFDESRSTKDKVIAYALEQTNVPKSRIVMVGDRSHDISGAKANGLKSIGVLYGYGDRAELTTAGADYIAITPHDVVTIID